MKRLGNWLARLALDEAALRAVGETWADGHYETGSARLMTRVRAALATAVGIGRVLLRGAFGFDGGRPMRNLGQDLRLGMRHLRAAPAFTMFAVVTLALGIGATTAIYSVVHAVVLQPHGLRDPERVVNIYHRRPPGSLPMIGISLPDFRDLQAQQTQFSHVTAWWRFREPVVANGRAELLMGEVVSGGYFDVVGARPSQGRLLQPSDDEPGSEDAIVISDRFWKSWFESDEAVVGRVMRIRGRPFRIIGVVEPGFRGVDIPNLVPTNLWMPLAAEMRLDPRFAERLEQRTSRALLVKGRLSVGSTVETAQTEVTAIAGRLDSAEATSLALRDRQGDGRYTRQWFVMPSTEMRVHESVDFVAMPLAATLMLAVGLVLLVACTNLTNLMLARAAGRQHDMAIRLALGASRWRLIREQLVEGSVMAIAGALAGMVFARWLMTVLSTPIPLVPGVVMQAVPRFNTPVVVAAIGATALTVVVFGLLPALRTVRTDVRGSLAGDSTAAPVRWRGRSWLIASQVMVSTILVALAALSVQQIRATASGDLGVDLDRVAAVQVEVGGSQLSETQARGVLDQALQQARRLPGVTHAALATDVPLGNGSVGISLSTVGGPPEEKAGLGVADQIVGSPDMFKTLGVNLIAGRLLTDTDSSSAEQVAVVTSMVARQLFGREDGVGEFMTVTRRSPSNTATGEPNQVRIVGVVEDLQSGGTYRRSIVYKSWLQGLGPVMSVIVRTNGDPGRLVEPLRRVVRQTAPDLAIRTAGTGLSLASLDNLTPKVVGALAGLLGGFALVLSLVGLFGVLSHVVVGRTREIAIRLALGAEAGRIVRGVIRQGLWPVLGGVAVGLVFGAIARLVMPRMPTGVIPAFDPIVLLMVPPAFLLAGLVACYLPARRAARVDPNVALRNL